MGRRGGLYGGWGWDGPYAEDETRIAVDIFEAKSRTPIWHASVTQSVSELTGPNAVVKINAATAAISPSFPLALRSRRAAVPPDRVYCLLDTRWTNT